MCDFKKMRGINEKLAQRLRTIQTAVGGQRELCRMLKIPQSTWALRLRDPGEIRLSEWRNIMAIAKDYGIYINPLEGYNE